MMCSHAHQICSKGKYVAIISTKVETAQPDQELTPALRLLGNIEHIFCTVSKIFQPTDDGLQDNVFVTASYDPTSHFESASREILQIWKTIHGQELELTIHPNC